MKRSKIVIPNRTADVRTLTDRESKLNTRKGIPIIRQTGFFDNTPVHEQLLFDNSQRNCNGYEEV